MRRFFVVAVAVLAAGCATQDHNPDISDPKLAERQQAMDETYCNQVAGGASIPPPVRIYEQPSYQVSGTVTTYGAGGYKMKVEGVSQAVTVIRLR